MQMMLYVLFLVLSMGAGGMMPWILQHTLGYLPFHAGASSSSTSGSSSPALQRVYREEPGYSYINNNTYGYCKKTSRIGGERGCSCAQDGTTAAQAGATAAARDGRAAAKATYQKLALCFFCPVVAAGNLPRGYPAPPLSPKGSRLFDAWHHQPISLRGIAWPGFNQQPPGLEGLAAGQLAAMEATDLHAIVHQLKLLGA